MQIRVGSIPIVLLHAKTSFSVHATNYYVDQRRHLRIADVSDSVCQLFEHLTGTTETDMVCHIIINVTRQLCY